VDRATTIDDPGPPAWRPIGAARDPEYEEALENHRDLRIRAARRAIAMTPALPVQ